MGGMTDLPGSLVELARLHGVATEYVDWTGRHAGVTDSTLVAVLDALGVPAATEDERIAALAAYDRDYWARPLPPTVRRPVRRGVGVLGACHPRRFRRPVAAVGGRQRAHRPASAGKQQAAF